MPTGKRKTLLSSAEISRSFADDAGQRFGPILTTEDVAVLLQVPAKTVYAWIAAGRLDGTFRKRGKRNLFWRDKVIDKIFNGTENW